MSSSAATTRTREIAPSRTRFSSAESRSRCSSLRMRGLDIQDFRIGTKSRSGCSLNGPALTYVYLKGSFHPCALLDQFLAYRDGSAGFFSKVRMMLVGACSV